MIADYTFSSTINPNWSAEFSTFSTVHSVCFVYLRAFQPCINVDARLSAVYHSGPDWNISTTLGCHGMLGRHLWSPGDPNDFVGPLTYHLEPPAGQSFHLTNDISQHLIGEPWLSVLNLVPMPDDVRYNNLGGPLTFPLVPPWGWPFWFVCNISTRIGWIVIICGTDIKMPLGIPSNFIQCHHLVKILISTIAYLCFMTKYLQN